MLIIISNIDYGMTPVATPFVYRVAKLNHQNFLSRTPAPLTIMPLSPYATQRNKRKRDESDELDSSSPPHHEDLRRDRPPPAFTPAEEVLSSSLICENKIFNSVQIDDFIGWSSQFEESSQSTPPSPSPSPTPMEEV